MGYISRRSTRQSRRLPAGRLLVPSTVSGAHSDRKLRVELLEPRRLLAVQPFPTPLNSLSPDAGLVFSGVVDATLLAPEVKESYTIEVGDGQLLTVVVDPDTALAVDLELKDPSQLSVGSVSTAASVDAVIQTVATVAGTYQIDVSGSHFTFGDFRLEVFVNAAVEEERHDGVSNDLFADAQDLSAVFSPLPVPGATRGTVNAALAAGPGIDDDWYQVQLADGQSASFVVDAPAGPSNLLLELYTGDAVTRLGVGTAADNASQHIDRFLDQTIDAVPTNYLVRVAGNATDYRLLITKEIAFDAEPNDFAGAAHDVSSIGATLGSLQTGDVDFYRVEALANDNLSFVATTVVNPVAAPGGSLDPQLALFDPTGAEIVHTNVIGDETLVHTALLDGTYIVRVAPTADGGVYVLEVTGNSGAPLPFAVATIDPTEGAVLAASPTVVTIDFSDDVDASTVELTDLLVDGSASVTAMNLPDGNTIVFSLPALTAGLHTLELAAGALSDLDGQSLDAFASQFTVDLTAPRVINSSLLEGDVVASGALVYTAIFSETMLATAIDASDITLVGQTTGSFAPTSLSYDAFTSTLTVQYESLPEDVYALTLLSGDGMFEDQAGNDLDGESDAINTVPSGDNVAGGDFTVGFSVEPPFAVAAVDPVDGAVLAASPTVVTIDFSDDVDASTVELTDLLVDGSANVTAMNLPDGNTIVFSLPALTAGLHTLELAAGALNDLDGQSLDAFTSQFTVDLTAPQVINSSLLEGDIVTSGPLVYTAVFSETMLATAIDASDITLVGQTTGSFAPTGLAYDAFTSTLTVQYESLPEDIYALTLLSGDGMFEDQAGNDLDGEPDGINTVPSGDTVAGGDFTVGFSVDQGAPAILSFNRTRPLGSLIFSSMSNLGLVNTLSDADEFEFLVQADSNFSVVATPVDPSAVLTLEVLGKTLPTAAAGPGAPVVLTALPIATTETMTLRLKGNRTTPFFLDVVMNATLEATVGDTTVQNRLDLGPSELAIGLGRLAAVGTSTPTTAAVGALVDEGNDTISTAIISGIGFGRAQYSGVGELGDNLALLDGALDVDFLALELAAGDQLTVDVTAFDIGSPLDAVVALFDANGQLLDLNDDLSSPDPFLDYAVSKQGMYYVGVSGFANLAYDPFVAGSGIPGTTGNYQIDIGVNGGGGPSGGSVTLPDDDFYSIDWTGLEGERVDIVLASQGQIDQSNGVLEILGIDGETVLAVATAQPLGIDAENFELAIFDFVVPEPGVYTLRFRSTTAGVYTLLVGQGIVVEDEPNGALTDPLRQISTSVTAIGYLGSAPSSVAILPEVAGGIAPDDNSPLASSGMQLSHPSLLTSILPAGVTYADLAAELLPLTHVADEPIRIPPSGELLNFIAVGENEPNDAIATATPLALGFDLGEDFEIDVTATISNSADIDFYRIHLEPGDVLGAGVTGAGQALTLRNQLGEELVGSDVNFAIFPPALSPLPRVGNAGFARVIDEAGDYAVGVSGVTGGYSLNLRLFRPPLESEPFGTQQRLFLDFDGASIDTTIFGSSGAGDLAPMRNFLVDWGLSLSDEDAVIDAVVASVTENLQTDIRQRGSNGDFTASGTPSEFGIEILNSRDHADSFGDPNVTRVIVGGTSSELGLLLIGVAEFIDVGNFDTTGTAVVLLDLLSHPDTASPNSLNRYTLAPTASKIDLIGVGVGNIVSHEAGHLFGAFHTDRLNAQLNIVDQGGNLSSFVGLVGSVWGDGDEIDVDFSADAYAPSEVFTGTQNTLNLISYGLSTGTVGGPFSGPIVTAIDPADKFVHSADLSLLSIDFDEPLHAMLANDPASYLLIAAGPNGVYDNGAADDVTIAMTPNYDGFQTVELTVDPGSAPLPVGRYRLTIGAAIEDIDGNPLNSSSGPGGGSDRLHDFEVVAIDPTSDLYQIDIRLGDSAVFRTATPFDDPASPQLSDLDPELTLYDPSGGPIVFDANSVDGKNAEIAFNPSQDGVYTIVVTAAAGGGEYVLDVEIGLLGNFNGDAYVNGDDFLSWQRQLGASVAPRGSGADGDRSGIVDGADLDLWQLYFGNATAAARAAVGDNTNLIAAAQAPTATDVDAGVPAASLRSIASAKLGRGEVFGDNRTTATALDASFARFASDNGSTRHFSGTAFRREMRSAESEWQITISAVSRHVAASGEAVALRERSKIGRQSSTLLDRHEITAAAWEDWLAELRGGPLDKLWDDWPA